jgi:hypothetical protein
LTSRFASCPLRERCELRRRWVAFEQIEHGRVVQSRAEHARQLRTVCSLSAWPTDTLHSNAVPRFSREPRFRTIYQVNKSLPLVLRLARSR